MAGQQKVMHENLTWGKPLTLLSLFSEVCLNYSMLRIIIFSCINVCSEKESTVSVVEGSPPSKPEFLQPWLVGCVGSIAFPDPHAVVG